MAAASSVHGWFTKTGVRRFPFTSEQTEAMFEAPPFQRDNGRPSPLLLPFGNRVGRYWDLLPQRGWCIVVVAFASSEQTKAVTEAFRRGDEWSFPLPIPRLVANSRATGPVAEMPSFLMQTGISPTQPCSCTSCTRCLFLDDANGSPGSLAGVNGPDCREETDEASVLVSVSE